jgi:hypothetical protein
MADNTVISEGSYTPDERLAAGAITPGELIEVDSNGEFQRQSSAGEIAPDMCVAREHEFEPDNTIDTDYAADEPVSAAWVHRGAAWRAMIEANENVSVGDELVPSGSGTLIVRTTEDRSAIVAKAEEADTDTSDFRLEVRAVK